MNFLYKVRGDFSPNGLQKIFFSFHPLDIEQRNKIADDILSIANCAIYYHETLDEKEEIDYADYESKLQEMKLFVVIVTTNYLSKDSFAKNWEYGFAVKHNIPILPITVETELEQYFETEMNRIGENYGDIQLLKAQVKDKTEITYRERLFRDLSTILVKDQEIEQIRKAFSGRIFLSYRKKDRKYAHELMRTIHSIPSLRNVSIWYDEFITSGENWSLRIEKALNNCDIFLLMVTPSIIEPDNYVIREEYPAARKCKKKIVSAKKGITEDSAIDIEKLQCLFPELKIYIDGDNTKELESALYELKDIENSSAEKDYLVGLAFFNGIEVEKDIKKAVSLIFASAERNLPVAINKLAEMYWIGDGIVINYENSIFWRKKLVELYEKNLGNVIDSEKILDYVEALERLVTCLYELSDFQESMYYGKRLMLLLEHITAGSNFSVFYQYLERVYGLCGKSSRELGFYDKAIMYAEKSYKLGLIRYKKEPTVTNFQKLSLACQNIGDAYYVIGDFECTKKWYQEAIEKDRKIDKKLNSISSAYNLSCSLLALGDAYMKNSMYEVATGLYAEAVDLRKRILEADNLDEHRKQYGEAIISKGTILMLKGDIAEAKKLFIVARDIFEDLSEQYGTIEYQQIYSAALNRCGKICEKEGDFDKALKYYEKSLERRKKILSHVRTGKLVFGYSLTRYFEAEIYKRKFENTKAKNDYEDIINSLLPIMSKDRIGDWHWLFSEAAFECFKLDTYSGKKYLQYAVDALKWLIIEKPDNKQYRKKYDICKKIFKRCYPE